MPGAAVILEGMAAAIPDTLPAVANLSGIERLDTVPDMIPDIICDMSDMLGQPATGKLFYEAQLKIARRVKELISQGIIVPQNITTTATNTSWRIWVQDSISVTSTNITATCGTTTIAWTDWNEQYVIQAGQILIPPRVSEEERIRREAQARAYQEEITRKEAERIAAETKADKLLYSCLTDEQKDELTKKNHFHLYVGNKKYRIGRGISGNIKLLDENDVPKHQYCIHPVGVPVGDVMLAQKLLLETNEAEFLRVANKHW